MKLTTVILFSMLTVLFTTQGYAQQVAINEDGSLPNPNAILDVKSFTRGVLFPRMSTTSRLAIPATKGLLVFDTTAGAFFFNTGSAWQSLSTGAGTGAGWLLSGNTGVSDSNFLGTINSAPLRIRVNNLRSGLIDFNLGNTFWGYNTGSFLPTDSSYHNTAIGYISLNSTTTGNHNTAAGSRALTSNTRGYYNTAIGTHSLYYNQNGFNNTATGGSALFYNNSGSNNTASGAHSLAYNSSGDGNVANGISALYQNTGGTSNTASGGYSLYSNTTGNYNSVAGYSSMYSNTIGQYNTAVANRSLYNNTTGWGNTAIGSIALYTNVSGHFITALGYGADIRYPNAGFNATAIGYNAVAYGWNDVRIGNGAINLIEGAVPWYTASDGRFKFEVQEDVKGLDFILQLRPVTYRFDGKRFDEQQNKTSDSLSAMISEMMQPAYEEAARIRRTGFIAQDVEKAAIASGYNFSGIRKPKSEQEHYSISYESFVVPLVKAVQEQQQQITSQQAIIEQQQRMLITLQQQLADIRKLLQQAK